MHDCFIGFYFSGFYLVGAAIGLIVVLIGLYFLNRDN